MGKHIWGDSQFSLASESSRQQQKVWINTKFIMEDKDFLNLNLS